MNPFDQERWRPCGVAPRPFVVHPPRWTLDRRPPPPDLANRADRRARSGPAIAAITMSALMATSAAASAPLNPGPARSTGAAVVVLHADAGGTDPDPSLDHGEQGKNHDHAGAAQPVAGAEGSDCEAHAGHAQHFAHAPIGVMGDHPHEPGQVMVSYRYMHMDMSGNRDGDDHTSVGDIFARGYMVAPTSMSMDMHMLGAMVGVFDRVTAMLMVPWLDVQMDHRTRAGGKFRTRSSGVGDLTLSTIVSVWQNQTHTVLLNTGLSFPTGSINERDDTPMGNQPLPYPMQLGSGTWDLLPGLTYGGVHDAWSWGLQFAATVRTGRNSNHYRLGNRYRTTAWTTWRPMDLEWLSTSLRLGSEVWENIDGHDPRLNPAVVPTADPNRRGGNRIDLGFGVSLLGTTGLLADHVLGIEVTRPIYQHLDGPQLETDWMITLGWEKAWY